MFQSYAQTLFLPCKLLSCCVCVCVAACCTQPLTLFALEHALRVTDGQAANKLQNPLHISLSAQPHLQAAL
jgi:hypothetical protein